MWYVEICKFFGYVFQNYATVLFVFHIAYLRSYIHRSFFIQYYVVKDCHAHVHVCLLGLRVANVLTRYLLVDKVYLITDVLDANSHQ